MCAVMKRKKKNLLWSQKCIVDQNKEPSQTKKKRKGKETRMTFMIEQKKKKRGGEG